MPYIYDIALVYLSIGVAIFGAFTGLVLTAAVASARPGQARVRVIMAAVSVGLSIWVMHLIGLLAVKQAVRVGYDPKLLGASLGVVIVFTCVALFLGLAKERNEWNFPAAVAVMAVGLAGMEYLGLAAISGGVKPQFALPGVAASAVTAVLASLTLLWLAFRRRGLILSFIGAIALGLLFAVLHYVAVQMVEFVPVMSLAGVPVPAFSEARIAWTAAGVTYITCSICLVTYAVFQFRSD
jgi:NO-binding membrane sensor protein with MHYT domain